MKKLRSVLVLFLLFSVTLMMGSNAEATQGKLTASSIEKCGSTLWGYHNPTRRHYHKAVYHKKSGYYALDWSHEYKKVGKCKYQLSTAKKKKKKKSTVSAHSSSTKKSSGNSSKNYSANVSSSSSSASVNKHVTDNDVAKADSSDSGIDKELDTLKDEENATPEISNFEDTNVDTQDTSKEDEGSNLGVTFIAGLIGGAIGGGIASYFVRKNRSKKKKDDLTNW